MPSLKDYVTATRPWSFGMSVISVSAGTLLAWKDGSVHPGWYLTVAGGIVFCHAGGNLLNDYFDTKNLVDHSQSPTALYRRHPILCGTLSPRGILIFCIAMFAAAAVIGVAAALLRSITVLWIAVVGLALTVFYTGGPIRLKYRALGEAAVFFIWGPLMFSGAYIVQRGEFSAETLIASVPFGALVALVLFANNLRDIEHDAASGVSTLATILGARNGLRAFSALMFGAYTYVGVAVIAGTLSPWTLLVFFSLPTAAGLIRNFRRSIPNAADALTARLDTVFGILFLAALYLDGRRF